MLLNPFTFHSPSTLNEAYTLLARHKDSRILAGGTILLNTLKVLKKNGSKTPAHVISLRHLPELKGLHSKGKALTLGAMTTLDELGASPSLTGAWTALKTACRAIGTTPIRNMATLGGNLACRYAWTELGAVLLALDAQLHFAQSDEKETAIPAERFFQNNARVEGILTRVTIPSEPGATSVYVRISKSQTIDLPLLAVCVKAVLTNGCFMETRVTINNATTFARRDVSLENFLNGKTANSSTVESAWMHHTADIYKTGDAYKVHMFPIAIKSALKKLADEK